MSQLSKIDAPGAPQGEVPRFALWRLGFRPFYLLGAGFAALAVPLWLLQYAGRASMDLGWAAQTWHVHEMVFGFAVAIVTGFLFTAVRNWTGLPTPTGARLIALCLLWVAARVAYMTGAPAAALAIELLFLALVAAALLTALVRARNSRNYFVGLLFVVLAVVDLVFYGAARGSIAWPDPVRAGRLGLYLIVLLTIVIGGRVIPMFTASAIRGLRQFRDVRLDRAALAATVLAFVLDLASVGGAALAAAASLAALLHAWRLAGWRPLATRSNPLLWVLHLAYSWLPVGLALLAASALGWVPTQLAMHAFGLGLIGGLVIGMITRTALGHTGRMLVAGTGERWMYALVHAAVVVRVVGPLIAPGHYLATLVSASALWSAGFALYLVVYGPRLVRARIDGRDG